MTLRALALFAALALPLSASAQEKDTRTPAEAYRGDTWFGLTICKAKLRMNLLRQEANEPQDEKSDAAGCIKEQRAAARVALDKMTKSTKKPAAREALKTYHVAVVSALDGILPGASEPRMVYEARQQALEGKVSEAWARVEVEL